MRKAKGALEPAFFGSIKFRIAGAVCLFVIALMTIDLFWNANLQREQAELEAHEKATVLAHEMRAAWDYVEINQNTVNRNEDGTIQSKTLVCVVAAKSISRLFMEQTDYTIRFVNENPRQAVDEPDDFERQALAAFKADPGLESYYRIEKDDAGKRVFRYAEPLYVTRSCLECHGEPAGELDQFGFLKEGMQVGDVGGAMSITEPMSIYSEGATSSTARQLFMMFAMLALMSASIYVIVNHVILRPVHEVSESAHRIAEGDFDQAIALRENGPRDEIAELKSDFNDMAAQLKDLYTSLEEKVEERTEEARVLNEVLTKQKADLTEAYNQLSRETAYKSDFFAIMSHELRTPLTSILAFARLLEESRDLAEKDRESVREIEQGARLLLDIVNNFLIMARAETGRNALVLEPVDFVDLVGMVKSQLAPLAAEKDIALEARADADVPLAMGDWEKLRRILENLGSNAIKYTHRGGSVEMHVSFGEAQLPRPDGDGAAELRCAVIMTVADDGIGIAPEDREVIFDYYRQAARQSPNRRYRGSGLGLAVVRELTELHGGTVTLESQVKKGSTFTVAIPYVKVDTEEYDEDSHRR